MGIYHFVGKKKKNKWGENARGKGRLVLQRKGIRSQRLGHKLKEGGSSTGTKLEKTRLSGCSGVGLSKMPERWRVAQAQARRNEERNRVKVWNY